MKKIGFMALCLAGLASVFSCTKDEGRIPDTGDLKMGIVMPGNESVVICVDLKDGSKASRAEVTWGETGSASFDMTSGSSFQGKIAVPEGTYVFRVKAFDAGGRQVIDFPMYGRSYGANYLGGLKNRQPSDYELDDDGNLLITWGANLQGSLRSKVSYTKDNATEPVVITVMPADTQTSLEGFTGDEFSVLSYYYPDMKLYDPELRPESVPSGFVYEEFASPDATVYSLSGPADVTSTYLKNAGPNIEGKGVVDNKFGLPVDWNYTDNIVNQNGNTTGGWKWENDEVKGVLHFESQDWNGPGFENGKVWQKVTLPVGTYRFTAGYRAGDGTPGMNMYAMAAKGDGLPDIEQSASALGFKRIPAGSTGEYAVIFTISEETDVSLGLVVTVDGSNHWQQFSHFKIEEIPVIDVTATYIRNAGPDMEYTELLASDTRWGILKDWQTNAAAKNQGNSTVGGWKGGGIGWETGWNDAAAIPNGKVWQSPTIPEGTYELTIGHGGVMDLKIVELYLVIASGSELPDVADLESNSISYMHLTEPGGERSLIFTLTESKQISLGILINTTAGESWIDAASWFRLTKLTTK